MRTSTLFAGIAASAALSLGLVGVASAAPAGPTGPTADSPAAVFASPTSAVPGATVQISGTCAMPTSGTDFPTVTSVTSPAFSAPASFINKAPDSFSGTATISSAAAAGSYPITLTCSNGSASSTVQVTGGSSKPNPAPAGGGTHHSSTTEGSSGTGSGEYSTGSGTVDGSDTTVTEEAPAQDPGWNGWEIAGVAALGAAAAGAGGYAVARRNRRRTDA
jgi:hypothetical protein